MIICSSPKDRYMINVMFGLRVILGVLNYTQEPPSNFALLRSLNVSSTSLIHLYFSCFVVKSLSFFVENFFYCPKCLCISYSLSLA